MTNISDGDLFKSLLNFTKTTSNITMSPVHVTEGSIHEGMSKDDAAWIMANAFLILTMQTGFGMLEAGCVSAKNVANIMVKNVVDVTLGGIVYWCIGYALSFGEPATPFFGYGTFFVSSNDAGSMGTLYSKYIFQFSFATAATTIVSGAVAERIKLQTYMAFSALNVFVYCLPASWAWGPHGWLKSLKFFDFAGACVVHLTGGASAIGAVYMLGPRLGRFTKDGQKNYGMTSPVTSLTGTFMLWWAWLAFNCGSTMGIQGDKWKTAAKAGVNTLNGSIGGSLLGLAVSIFTTWKKENIVFHIPQTITSILGGLIGVTACCAVITPLESFFIGGIGAAIAIGVTELLEKFELDDPVGAIPVHFGAAIWSVLAVGLFGVDEFGYLSGYNGLFKGGGFYLFGVQLLGVVAVGTWSLTLTVCVFAVLDKLIGVRMGKEEEIMGADWVEHRINNERLGSKLESALKSLMSEDGNIEEMVGGALNKIVEASRRDDGRGRIRNFRGQSSAVQDHSNINKNNNNEVQISVISPSSTSKVHPESNQPANVNGDDNKTGAMTRNGNFHAIMKKKANILPKFEKLQAEEMQ